MKFWVLWTAGAIALFSSAARAQDEGAATPPPQNEQFRSSMDRVFGRGQWRETSGYRSQAREDELRREGAGTVPLGVMSHHSMGSPDAPGAYDVIVAGMSTQSAAIKLKASGEPVTRVIAERAHGAQGSHLHIESSFAHGVTPAPQGEADDSSIYLRVVNGKRNPLLVHASHSRRPTG